jgi:KUP system potassium uptake protein
MVFWNWAKGLEEAFDRRNRRQLSNFIVGREDNDAADSGEDDADTQTLYCVAQDNGGKRALGRVPLLAVFHRMAHEKGVPYSYISACSSHL